ncbi:hypothetical protein [Streptomyces avermitilis]|uniref:hypothetical protein n=1 Tax=Streptomyces avermitilis TaxID=33903 RepID=UPI003808DE30
MPTAIVAFAVPMSQDAFAATELENGSFEQGRYAWAPYSTAGSSATSSIINNNSAANLPHYGSWKARLGGRGIAGVDRVTQSFHLGPDNIPVLKFSAHITPPAPQDDYREFNVIIWKEDGTPYTLLTRTNKDSGRGYEDYEVTFPQALWFGRTHPLKLEFQVISTGRTQPVLVDDVAVVYKVPSATT